MNALNYAVDFRSEAVLASNRFCDGIGVRPSHGDLTALGVSLCLPASGDPRAEASAVRRHLIVAYVGMIALLVCGGAIFVAAKFGPFATPFGSLSIPDWTAAIPTIAGWTMMCSLVNIEHWIVRRRIAGRGTGEAPFPVTESPMVLRLEDPETYTVVKLLIDDVAIGWCDASRGVMQLEGFAYRYVIWARDICTFERLGNRFVLVKFRIADSDRVLALAVAMNGVAIELKKQLSFGGAARAVEAPFRRVFGLVPPGPSA